MMEHGVRIRTVRLQQSATNTPASFYYQQVWPRATARPSAFSRRPSRQPMGLFSGAHEARSSVRYTISVGKTRPALVRCKPWLWLPGQLVSMLSTNCSNTLIWSHVTDRSSVTFASETSICNKTQLSQNICA